jgi:hypothetical protein
MDALSFKRDFAYKFIKATSFLTDHSEKTKIILPLWRADRLSLIRALIFLEVLFKHVTIKKTTTIRIKYKRADKKTYKKTIFFIQIVNINTDLLFLLLDNLPEPKTLGTTLGYVLIYPFNHFVMQIPCTINNPIFTYKLIPYLKVLENAKIY